MDDVKGRLTVCAGGVLASVMEDEGGSAAGLAVAGEAAFDAVEEGFCWRLGPVADDEVPLDG